MLYHKDLFKLAIFYEGAKLLRAFLQRGQMTESLFTEGPKNWGAFLQYDLQAMCYRSLKSNSYFVDYPLSNGYYPWSKLIPNLQKQLCELDLWVMCCTEMVRWRLFECSLCMTRFEQRNIKWHNLTKPPSAWFLYLLSFCCCYYKIILSLSSFLFTICQEKWQQI